MKSRSNFRYRTTFFLKPLKVNWKANSSFVGIEKEAAYKYYIILAFSVHLWILFMFFKKTYQKGSIENVCKKYAMQFFCILYLITIFH